MNKSMKPSSPVARQQVKPLTPEEIKEQQMRAYLQKKASLAEGIIFNLIQGTAPSFSRSDFTSHDVKRMVSIADAMATEFMKVVYKAEVTEDTEEE